MLSCCYFLSRGIFVLICSAFLFMQTNDERQLVQGKKLLKHVQSGIETVKM